MIPCKEPLQMIKLRLTYVAVDIIKFYQKKGIEPGL